MDPPPIPKVVTILAGTTIRLFGDFFPEQVHFAQDSEVALLAVLERTVVVAFPFGHRTLVPLNPDLLRGLHRLHFNGIPDRADPRSWRAAQVAAKRGLANSKKSRAGNTWPTASRSRKPR